MNERQKRWIEEVREEFQVTHVTGSTPVQEVIAETLADMLNRKHGHEVVVRRDKNHNHHRSL